MFPNANAKNISYKTVHNQSVQNQSSTDVPYDEDWKSVLRRYDTDGDGVLSRKDLKQAFKNMGSKAPAWRALRALRQADTNRDGFIGQKEFANLVRYANERGYVL